MRPPYAKYRAKKIVTTDGQVFDSKLEFNRFMFLQLEQEHGRIINLQRQVKFVLIPVQRIIIQRIGKRGKPIKPKFRIAEKECAYFADFVFDYILPDGSTTRVIEDAKGLHTKEYIIKRKLMRTQGNIICEVKKPSQPIQYQYIYPSIQDNTITLHP